MNGKRFTWQAVTLLPFIDEQRLLAAIAKREGALTSDEQRRNSFRLEVAFNRMDTTFGQLVVKSLADVDDNVSTEARTAIRVPLQPDKCNSLCGQLAPPYGPVLPKRLRAPFGLGEAIEANYVVAATFLLPPHQQHVCEIMDGTSMPRRTLCPKDKPFAARLWHEKGPWMPNAQQHDNG